MSDSTFQKPSFSFLSSKFLAISSCLGQIEMIKFINFFFPFQLRDSLRRPQDELYPGLPDRGGVPVPAPGGPGHHGAVHWGSGRLPGHPDLPGSGAVQGGLGQLQAGDPHPTDGRLRREALGRDRGRTVQFQGN